MRTQLKRIVGAASMLPMATAVSVQAGVQDTWQVDLVPYVWAAGLDADVSVNGRSTEVDTSFGDILDHLDMAGAFLLNARYHGWVMRAQVDYLALGSDLKTQPGGELETDLTMATLGVGYQFEIDKAGHTLDIFLGVRNLTLDNDLKVDTVGKFSGDRDVTDPILIVEPSFKLSDRWRFNPMFSYGKGGDSELTYEIQPQLLFQAWESVQFRFGYRRLHYEIESDNKETSFDGDFEGPFIGIGITLGSAPAPAPTPVAAVPMPLPAVVPPRDSDGDGVIDSRDQCPNSARGERVDAVGCGYEIRVEAQFDTNSATIKPESYEALDRAIDLLNRVPTMRGVIEGHTDSSGGDAYNRALSERRAAAVSAYLVKRGVDASRVPSKGFGETQPIADNRTPEGRALNRRVVLRRTDGGQ